MMHTSWLLLFPSWHLEKIWDELTLGTSPSDFIDLNVDRRSEPIPNSNGSENGIYPPNDLFWIGKMISIK